MRSRCALNIAPLRSSVLVLPPLFLAPRLAPYFLSRYNQCLFSTTTPVAARTKKRRDGNPERGVSALRRTGLRKPVGMSWQPLPKPVLDPKRKSKIQVDPGHGLWGFFNQKGNALSTPKEDRSHGIPCTIALMLEPG